MIDRVERLQLRRRLLEAECAVQRGEIGALHSDIDAGVARVDHGVGVVRRLTPVLMLAGAAIAIAIGPGRIFRLARRGLAFGLVASRASRLLR